MEIQNTGNQFTFYRGTARTIFDVTFTKGLTLGAAVQDWRVMDQVQGSLMLEWRLMISAVSPYKSRNWNKGDWNLFQTSLEEICGQQRSGIERDWIERRKTSMLT